MPAWGTNESYWQPGGAPAAHQMIERPHIPTLDGPRTIAVTIPSSFRDWNVHPRFPRKS
jgi:hypothetical protein